ncbi:hypothetical protein EVAR_5577_1 [Eumeta japonica]|uniref:Secreted protein n=1 Tax=Eumeta variegata TaxID=151549 RepID=A0A4C1U1T3_EUMVA|nr:hypothetical protein EVAR_5577_1 [Eumeta japonica]
MGPQPSYLIKRTFMHAAVLLAEWQASTCSTTFQLVNSFPNSEYLNVLSIQNFKAISTNKHNHMQRGQRLALLGRGAPRGSCATDSRPF